MQRLAMPEQTMGSSIFVALADLVSKIRAGGTEIRTAEFLDVCRQIIPVLDKFGASFALVRSDVNGNIQRLAAAQQRDPGKFATLFSTVLDEKARGAAGGKYSDARGLLWLKRAMEFVISLLGELATSQEEALSTAASKAYYETLYRFHTWYTSAAFQVALKLAPSRETFFASLGQPGPEQIRDMATFVEAFSPVLAEIQEFLAREGLDDPTPV